MKFFPLALSSFALSGALLACGRGDEPGERMKLTVAPLQLDEVTNAVYELRVFNGANQLVWSKTVSADQFGDGLGAITYIGTCDASAGVAQNRVELELSALYKGNGEIIPPEDYQNPAPVGAPLVQTYTCLENEDVPVTFNLTIMRSAIQGFFDVAVNFSDVFCSAKVDCVGDLLHNPASGERDETVVVGFACTSGQAVAGQPVPTTWLHMSDVELVCGSAPNTTTYTIDPSGELGNQGGDLPAIFQASLFRDNEDLPGVDKCYWNTAIGIVPGPGMIDCHVKLRGTASEQPFVDGSTPDNTTYPVVDIDVQLTDSLGNQVCNANHPLNGVPAGVATRYTPIAGEAFEHHWKCGEDEVTGGVVTCTGTQDGSQASFSQTDTGIVVTVNTTTTQVPYQLPAEWSLDGCCINPCCQD